MSATTLVIDDALAERVARIAEEQDLPVHTIMVSAISDYVERAEARADLAREGDKAWAEHRRPEMPRVVVTLAAVRGLERCRQLRNEVDPDALERAAQQISAAFRKLEATP